MPRSGSRRLRWTVLAALLGVLSLGACDELNPHFDPDGGPLCETGDRQCSGAWTQVCQPGDPPWVNERECWTGTSCSAGVCLPDDPGGQCEHQTDCAASEVCTALVASAESGALDTYCIPPPNPAGRPSGQPCTNHEDCLSGWCFRSLCFEACTHDDQCTNTLHECGLLEVTVDGVRQSVGGCVPPS